MGDQEMKIHRLAITLTLTGLIGSAWAVGPGDANLSQSATTPASFENAQEMKNLMGKFGKFVLEFRDHMKELSHDFQVDASFVTEACNPYKSGSVSNCRNIAKGAAEALQMLAYEIENIDNEQKSYSEGRLPKKALYARNVVSVRFEPAGSSSANLKPQDGGRLWSLSVVVFLDGKTPVQNMDEVFDKNPYPSSYDGVAVRMIQRRDVLTAY